MEYRVPVIVEPLEEGGYYAECPILHGCHVEGATYLEALENLEDAIRLHIEGRLEFGDPLPPELDGATSCRQDDLAAHDEKHSQGHWHRG